MLSQVQFANREEAEMLGDLHPLIDQLGSTEGLISLHAASQSLRVRRVDSLSALRLFLETYQAHLLVPVELPAIQRAFLHANRYEVRELIAYDQQMAQEPLLRDFAPASQRVGQCHLKRFRPLRDVRVLQRYLQAVEKGQAHGWHTLVYGLTLAVFALPVRQGLVFYERQVLRGFIHAAARALRLKETTCQELFEALCGDLSSPAQPLLFRGQLGERRIR